MDAKQRTPSVIARLMGLDELPPQQSVQKQRRVLSENYLQRVASIGVREKRSSRERWSFRMSIEEQQEMKDIFLGLESLKRDKSCNLSVEKGKIDSTLSDTTRAIMSQEFHLSMDKKLQNSNGFHDAGEVTVSNKDLFPKRPQEPITKESACYRSRVSREITKEFTKQMRHGVSNNFLGISKSRFRNSDSLAKNYVVMHVSPNFFDGKSRFQSPKSIANGSYMAGEAKKKVSRKGKMTKRFQRVGLASDSSTLGDMLGTPDNEERPRNLDYKPAMHGQSNCIGPSDGDANLGSFTVISSRDGWKDGCVGNKQGFRSVPLSTAIRSPKTETRLEAPQNDRYWRPGGQRESRWQNVNQKDGSKSRNSRFRCNKSESFPYSDSGNSYSVKEIGAILDNLKNKLEEKDLSEPYSTVSKSSTCNISCSDPEYNHTMKETSVISNESKNKIEDVDQSKQRFCVPKPSTISVDFTRVVADVVTDAKTEVAGGSFRYPEETQSEPTTSIFYPKDDGYSSRVQQETSTGFPEEGSVSSHCSGSDAESLVCLGATYQPTPDSVLEPLFKDELSSSPEYFESIGADPHGLLMKLQLLKSESSEAYSEGSGMVISSDDDNEEGSVDLSEENDDLRLFSVAQSRDFSYIIDVLTEAGFHGRNPDMAFDKWHSPESPISHSAFETLEKKYGGQTSWKRSERRILFERINSGLSEILQPCMGVPMWAKPVAERFSAIQSREVKEELWMLLVKQETDVSKDSWEKVLGREFGSLELKDDIEEIGREVERLLIDELAAEFVSI